MHKLALVGRDISHSLSQKMYEDILGESVNYSLLDFQSNKDIPTLTEIFSDGLLGLSITSPYKSHFLNEVVIRDKNVELLNVINCIKKVNNHFEATNTDLLACREIIKSFAEKEKIDHVIILGNGHMAKTIVLLLNELSIPFKKYYRKKHGDISNLSLINPNDRELVINCCSRSFNFEGDLQKDTIFWDLNYSHKKNAAYLSALCTYIDGLELLRLQARYAVDFWEIS